MKGQGHRLELEAAVPLERELGVRGHLRRAQRRAGARRALLDAERLVVRHAEHLESSCSPRHAPCAEIQRELCKENLMEICQEKGIV